MEKKNYYTALILKHLAGEIRPAEYQALQAWLAEHEEHRQFFKSIRANWHAEVSGVRKAETAYYQLTHRLGLEEEQAASEKLDPTRKMRKANTYWLRAAASFTGLLMLAAIAYYHLSGADTLRYETGYGETATFILPDSSVVTLNANSTLEYTGNWKKQTSREVWLNGEAFFHVRKIQQNTASQLPAKFVVHTSNMDVEVLGTEFNVNERRGKTTVVLNSGKVKLNSNLNPNEALVMEPGEYVELSVAHKQFVKKIVDPELFSSWTEKKLILDNTTLGEVAQAIEDYYGLKVVFEDVEVAEKALTGSIPMNDLDTFLTVLSASIDVQMYREGNTLVISNEETPKGLI